ncbi:MAG: serine hydrolase domain-containing protein [Pseudomonadota bacterium]
MVAALVSAPVHSANAVQARLEALQANRDDVPGFALALIENGSVTSAATGEASPDGALMTAQTPFRLASVTKTFVAAALLRLSETGRLDLDSPIERLISSKHSAILRADGYEPEDITVRHLLMHSAGLADHFASEEGIAVAFANPQRLWTRTQQLALMTRLTDPLGKPGEAFSYSDTGYILLGEIIEMVTGEPLAEAVRSLNSFQALGIASLRWEALIGEEPAPVRAHQYFQGADIFDWNGSLDAFGGGGLIGNVEDTARYFDALFSGKIFAAPETLELMMSAPGHPKGSPYRLGLFVREVGGHDVYSHGGFWGVQALHVPSLNLTIVCVALAEEGERAVTALAYDLIEERAAP